MTKNDISLKKKEEEEEKKRMVHLENVFAYCPSVVFLK